MSAIFDTLYGKPPTENIEEASPQSNKIDEVEKQLQGKIDSTKAIVEPTEKKAKAPASLTYQQMFEMLNPNKPETPDEKAKREKKEKRDTMFAAIGDGLSAMANLYFTTKGAPNMYTGTNTMSAAAKARFDKLKAEREANAKAYTEGMMRARAYDEAKTKDDRNWQRQLERDYKADEKAEAAERRAQAKEDRDQALYDLNVQLQNQKISQAEAAAKKAAIEADYAERIQQGKIDLDKARVGQANAAAAASAAKASGGGSRAKYKLTIEGETHEYDTQAEYEKEIMKYAAAKGIKGYEDVLSGGKTNHKGQLQGATQKQRDKRISQLAAEVEKAYEKKEKKQSPTGESGGGKKSPTA